VEVQSGVVAYGERKPAEEIIIVNVPALIEPELFERVQQQLAPAAPVSPRRG
jgi:hypothetical protein